MTETERINFNAPSDLVEMADLVADLRGVSRTALLTEALEDRLEDVLTDEAFRTGVRNRYFAGELDRETVARLLGEAEAVRIDLLRQSLEREVPQPDVEADLPTDEEFYGREPPTVCRDESSPDEDPEAAEQ